MSQDFKHNYFYSYKEQYPLIWDELPHRIRLSNGRTRTDKESFTKEELKDAGYALVDRYPNYNDETHVCTWNGADWVVTQHRDPNKKIIFFGDPV